jgi:hypothetical protein
MLLCHCPPHHCLTHAHDHAHAVHTYTTNTPALPPRYDPDELEEEQRERERRNKINGEFQLFVKRVQEMWSKDSPDLQLEFDIPFRELGFSGVPHRCEPPGGHRWPPRPATQHSAPDTASPP